MKRVILKIKKKKESTYEKDVSMIVNGVKRIIKV